MYSTTLEQALNVNANDTTTRKRIIECNLLTLNWCDINNLHAEQTHIRHTTRCSSLISGQCSNLVTLRTRNVALELLKVTLHESASRCDNFFSRIVLLLIDKQCRQT